jgi:hypothetical protein
MIRRLTPLLLVAACGKPATPASTPGADTAALAATSAASAATAPAPAADSSAAPETLHFTSSIAGFDLTIPAAWGRRYTVSERSEPEEFPKARHVVEFMYLPDEGGIPPTWLSVLEYSAGDWAAVKARSTGEVVAERDGRVWVAIPPPKTTPLRKGSPDEQRFEAGRVTAAQVKPLLAPR